MAAHTPSLLGLERSREESFYNRLNALYEWFVRELSQKLGSG
jgi:flagellin-specific chaperone FliS